VSLSGARLDQTEGRSPKTLVNRATKGEIDNGRKEILEQRRITPRLQDAAVISGRAPDCTSPERQALLDVTRQRGGIAALMGDYVLAQVPAGPVAPPTFASVPAQAGSR
jgi:hypothetical protein